MNTWNLFQEAKGWGCTPSDLLQIEEPYTAYCLNQAVSHFGAYVTGELEKIEGKDSKAVARKRQQKLEQLLRAPGQRKYKSFRQAAGKAPAKK